MFRSAFALFVFLISVAATALAQNSVLECMAWGEDGCLEGELSKALTNAEQMPLLKITKHLSLIQNQNSFEPEEKDGGEESTLERLERYLYGHSLKLELPEELVSGARGLISDHFLAKIPTSLTLPLAEDGQEVEERRRKRKGFVKKVILPFILGLKFKTTFVIPIAIALIALKTWKALTLGLLSIVLSAALVIFKLTRPKVLNYEVVYPPTHAHHHVVDDHFHHGRSADQMAYNAYRR